MESSPHPSTSRSSSYAPHHRIVLLFDLDCFYAQCERVRLGLDPDVSLALLQWNSVLAVTYPAREFGIQRGDSWDAVAEKSHGTCWAIHLRILEKAPAATATTEGETSTHIDPETKAAPTTTVKNPYLKVQSKPSTDENDHQPAPTNTSQVPLDVNDHETTSTLEDEPIVANNIEEAYNQIYKLTREEQLECQKRERGVRRYHHEGKACLERYRLASMRIFSVVLESLTQRLGGKHLFTLERASIDEFYLDITNYCYQACDLTLQELTHKTVAVGQQEQGKPAGDALPDLQSLALERACQVSHWIRQDVGDTLGFTMSAGICTNKMMAKLAASYGKPNGQAGLHPRHFPSLLQTTKIRKVRHFGGKLGKQVLNVLREYSSNPAFFDADSATMEDLQQVPLPVLQQRFSEETAHFVFEACRGVDEEAVRETTGALVKSITAFKSFPATSQLAEIQNWLTLMSNEVVTRVAKDSARNHRYPKTCTLNYTYYATDTGRRPTGVTSTRNFRNSKSIRLHFPPEKYGQKVQDLVEQSVQKLQPILKQHPLRGVGLSASNFETRGCPPEGIKGITTFLVKKDESVSTEEWSTRKLTSNAARIAAKRKRKPDIEQFFSQQSVETTNAEETTEFSTTSCVQTEVAEEPRIYGVKIPEELVVRNDLGEPRLVGPSSSAPKPQAQEDEELAKRLQASFDRENYVLTAANRFRPNVGSTVHATKLSPTIPSQATTKARRIDSFFKRK